MAEKCDPEINLFNQSSTIDSQGAVNKNLLRKRNRLPNLESTQTTSASGKSKLEINSLSGKDRNIFNENLCETKKNIILNVNVSQQSSDQISTRLSKTQHSANSLRKDKIKKQSKCINENSLDDIVRDESIFVNKNEGENEFSSTNSLNHLQLNTVIEISSNEDSKTNPIDNIDSSSQFHHDKDNIIFLETPVTDTINISLLATNTDKSRENEKTLAKPKRLSEEFLSSDDNEDCITQEFSNPTSNLTRNITKNSESSESSVNGSNMLTENSIQNEGFNNKNQNDEKLSILKTSSGYQRNFKLDDENTSSSSLSVNNILTNSTEESHFFLENCDDDNEDVNSNLIMAKNSLTIQNHRIREKNCLDDDIDDLDVDVDNDENDEDNDDDEEDVPTTTTSSLCDTNSFAGIHESNDNEEIINTINNGTLSSESTVSYYDNDVQSMDAIERRDFEHEQRLTGGILLKTQSLYNNKENKLNLEIVKSLQNSSEILEHNRNKSKICENENILLSKDSPITSRQNQNLTTTPTSSRVQSTSRLNKSAAKLNLSLTLNDLNRKIQGSFERRNDKTSDISLCKKCQPSTSKLVQHIDNYSSNLKNPIFEAITTEGNSNDYDDIKICSYTQKTSMNATKNICLAHNPNSNDSLSSDKSYCTSAKNNLHSLPNTSLENRKPKHQFHEKNKNSSLSEYIETNKQNLANIEPVASTSRSQINNLELIHSTKIVKTEKKDQPVVTSFQGASSSKYDYATVSKASTSKSIEETEVRNQLDSLKLINKVKMPFASLEENNFNILNSSSNKLNKKNNLKIKLNKKHAEKQESNEQNMNEEVNVEILPVDILQRVIPQSDDRTVQRKIDTYNNQSSDMQIQEIVIREDYDEGNQQHESDFIDDETWVDCEEGSDEEICTCSNNNTLEEDDLPSKNVDLSNYLQMTTLPDDMFLQENASMATEFTTSNSNLMQNNYSQQRKRKYNANPSINTINHSMGSPSNVENLFNDVNGTSNRKRIALDYTSTPRNTNTNNYYSSPPITQLTIATQHSLIMSGNEIRRTPRSIIPTKDNPPPELHDWLTQFQRWSHAERLLAVDRLIEHCEPQQVRHMMKVIEPQFQRDFISLLPRELALQVLSYLEPKDLLRAAQTCRSWRYLCDDNLLWKEKCKAAQITTESKQTKDGLINNDALPKRGRAGNMPPISSPWKAAYMRQHIIEMNWRSRPIRQPKILKGHDDHVITCLQFSGNRIVSGSDDNTLKVWSAVTGKCLRTLVGHTGGVWSSQMSGNIIISGSTDRTLKVWNMETGECIHTLLGHTSTVRCMHLHGKKVVSGSRDATLRVWDIEQGSCLHVLVGHLAAVRCVQYDGKLIVSGAYDYMVKIWHPERQECLHTLQGHTNRVYSLQFDGIHVVSGSLDTSIRVWDAETGNPKHTLMGHQSLTSGMELRQNILVSGNADSTVKVWDITTGQCLQTLSGPNKHQSAVTCLQFNSRFVITSSDDGTVKLWDVKTGDFIRNLVALESGGSGGVVWRIRASDTKLICAVGSRNGTEETKLMVLDFDVEGACVKCS